MQITFDHLLKKPIEVNHEIRLIELFGGVGSQAMALRNIGAKFQHYRLVEFDKYPVMSYNAIHGTNFEPLDIRNIKGEDLGVVNTERYTYLLTYLLIPLPRFIACWKTERYDKRIRHTFRIVMGS